MSREGVSFRQRLYLLLDSSAWPRVGMSPLNKFLVLLILVSVFVAILESEPLVYLGHEVDFLQIEIVFATVFLIEYIARLWVCAENPQFANGWRGRLSYALTPAALFDLLAATPLLFVAIGTEAFVLRLFRMIGILRLSKLGRYSAAMATIRTAILSRRYELIMSIGIAGVMLLLSSTLLYIVEGATQPAAFGSIPRAMWWSISALTTVGYGDVIPATVLGRILAGATAIIGIGLIAMPTGILAAAFSDAMVRQREKAADSDIRKGGLDARN